MNLRDQESDLVLQLVGTHLGSHFFGVWQVKSSETKPGTSNREQTNQ